MLEETGYVVSVEGDYAWVETSRKSACQSCTVNKGCGTSVLAKMFGEKTNHIRAKNTLDATVGDEIVLGMQEGGLVKGSLIIYALPLLFMILSSMLAEHFLTFGSQTDEFVTIFAGLFGLVAGFLVVRWFSSRMANDSRYQPVILRRTGKHIAVNVMM
jgi:sigma-E factor negative regulatory protein RseC